MPHVPDCEYRELEMALNSARDVAQALNSLAGALSPIVNQLTPTSLADRPTTSSPLSLSNRTRYVRSSELEIKVIINFFMIIIIIIVPFYYYYYYYYCISTTIIVIQ